MEIINEKTTATLTVDFFDENGSAVIPSVATYQIDDVASGQAVKAETGITPLDTSVDIFLAVTETSIINETLGGEERLVTVKFQYSTNKRGTKDFRYIVKNLSKVS